VKPTGIGRGAAFGPPRPADTHEVENLTMAIKPLEDRVLVKPIEAETKTASGLYLPESAKEKPVRGRVVAVGPGKRLENGKRAEMSVKAGSTVVYGKYAGSEVEIKGEKHLIIRESELLGVLEG
jgi:chaperonin GroES